MGYCVTIHIRGVKIKKENVRCCLAAVNKLFEDDKKYAWVPKPKSGKFTSLSDAFAAWSHTIDLDKNLNLDIISFDADKWGDEEVFYEAIAPFVEDNGTIVVSGEDGEIWRYLFKNGEIKTQFPVFVSLVNGPEWP